VDTAVFRGLTLHLLGTVGFRVRVVPATPDSAGQQGRLVRWVRQDSVDTRDLVDYLATQDSVHRLLGLLEHLGSAGTQGFLGLLLRLQVILDSVDYLDIRAFAGCQVTQGTAVQRHLQSTIKT